MVEQPNNEFYKLWLSTSLGMEIKNPIWDQWRMEREMRYQQYQKDLKSELPSWMSEKLFLAIERSKREEIKKSKPSLIKRVIKGAVSFVFPNVATRRFHNS